MHNPPLPQLALVASLALAASLAAAQDINQLKKTLSENLQGNPTIQEVTKTDVPGIYEVRLNGADIAYTDETGKYLFVGKMIDLKSKRNLTEERIDKLTAIKWKELPLSDAITYTRGNGSRKVAIFADPNCGYCKRLETELLKVDNLEVSVFLLPILGADSTAKAKAAWCADDKGKVWLDWMTKGAPVPSTTPACDTGALGRNLALATKHAIRATPALYFANDRKVGGYIDSKQVEAILAEVGGNKARQ